MAMSSCGLTSLSVSISSSGYRSAATATVAAVATTAASSRIVPPSAFFGDRAAWCRTASARSARRRRRLVVVAEFAGQYEDGFEDVHKELINLFTYKAVRTVLHQLYEMNPPSYRFLYNFIAANTPTDGGRFLRLLVKEKQDLAERVMITRLHLYGKWIKKLDHATMYQRISDENLQLMRERLMETVIWPPSDDTNTNTEKVG